MGTPPGRPVPSPLTVGAAPAPCRHARNKSIAVRFSRLDRVQGVGTGGFPTHRPDPDTDCGPPATPAFARLPPRLRRRHPPPSWPDLFRPSTSRGIAVRAGRGRGGGPTWIPGTSPGMTVRAQRSFRGRRQRRPRHRARPDVKPDSSGTSPGMTEEMSRASPRQVIHISSYRRTGRAGGYPLPRSMRMMPEKSEPSSPSAQYCS